MRINLAWRNLVHERARTIVAALGVAFAVVLIFMQLGFLEALRRTANIIYSALDFDICLQSRDYLHLSDSRNFPQARLYQAASVPEVVAARPYYVGIRPWRHPRSGEKRGILVMGVRVGEDVFLRRDIQQEVNRRLTSPERALIDSMTRPEFGPINGVQFGDEDVRAGVETEISQRRIKIVGYFMLGTGFAANGAVLVSESGFFRLSPPGPQLVNLGLIKVDERWKDRVSEVARKLEQQLPDDVQVLTREETMARERDRWVKRTAFGSIFQMGIGIALFVGTVIVYQVLSSDLASLLPEYATMKAMGYGNRFLAGVVVQQALLLSIFGFIPGYLCSVLLYFITSNGTRIP